MAETPTFSTPEAASYAMRPHAVNVAGIEYDWLRLKAAARSEGTKSAGHVIRLAVTSYLDSHPESDHIAAVAQLTVEHMSTIEQMRAALPVDESQP
jgi:hypothetical protein